MPYLLFVDGEPRMRTLGTRLLHDQLGYEVKCAASAAEAIELVRAEAPHVMVTGVDLPDKDGLWLVARAREHAPDLPVVLISDVADPPSKAAKTHYPVRPFSREALIEALNRALGTDAPSTTPPAPALGHLDRRQTPPCPNCGRQNI
jgi:DNA-binding NtrC family response regulator